MRKKDTDSKKMKKKWQKTIAGTKNAPKQKIMFF
jgi:hypothetical protein